MARTRRHITEVIDEMLGIIPESKIEFIAELNLLSQLCVGLKLRADFAWDELGNICERNMGVVPSEAWHYHIASVIYRQPVAVIMKRVQNV